ncbi:Mitochondrial import inner membrane translocase subunit Tim8 A [Intoshia linei]|uniref:Mitochondrial import inner membrane translocase subunit n=1 Tax=Intoshia linei TaxID=1819745 RepID=A0A177BA18_9BILA|nr:Mitochondrial import inner membrane translocase subunit Tim8 A [Intoshia linei]
MDEKNQEKILKFANEQRQKQELTSYVHKLTDICWDTCISSISHKLDSKSSTCVDNCVNRYFDMQKVIATRLTKLASNATNENYYN